MRYLRCRCVRHWRLYLASLIPCERALSLLLFKNSPFQNLFHELLSQYYTCLYLFLCISHGDSKYSYKLPHAMLWSFERKKYTLARTSRKDFFFLRKSLLHKFCKPILSMFVLIVMPFLCLFLLLW